MLPCSRVNHMSMKETPGPLFTRIINAWSESVGVDIIAQAKKYRHVSSNVWRESADKKAHKERAKK
jgi:hypothetical protein